MMSFDKILDLTAEVYFLFYSILTEEVGMVGGGWRGGLHCPQVGTPPLRISIHISRREEGKGGRFSPFPLCLWIPHPHKRIAIDLHFRRAPLVRRLPFH